MRISDWSSDVCSSDLFECIFCMVDMHAITASLLDPDDLRRSTRELAAAMIASGIDPRKNILFNQSQNPDNATLAWIFNCIARLGWLNRITQVKKKAGKDPQNVPTGLQLASTPARTP